jgi:hypothetical protein
VVIAADYVSDAYNFEITSRLAGNLCIPDIHNVNIMLRLRVSGLCVSVCMYWFRERILLPFSG